MSIKTFYQAGKDNPDIFLEIYFALRRTGKVYQTKVWKYASNPSPTLEKVGDNEGLSFTPSTDTTEGTDDYEGIPLFDWWHCNYIRDKHGDPYITALENTPEFSETGNVDVGAMGMTFYWNVDTSNSGYDLWTISDSPHPELGLVPWVESVRADGSIAPYWCHSAYFSVLGDDGLPHSQPNKKMIRKVSYNNIITSYGAKGKGYRGAGASRNLFQIIFNVIMGATKDSQSLYKGVTNYSFQYPASVQSAAKAKYFPVTNAQAANIEVGTYVSVGYGVKSGDTVNIDRGNNSMHSYADDVKVLKIETLDENNKAIYLDCPTSFNTTPVNLSGVSAEITMSSMHCWTGETNRVIGKHNGSAVSNTSGKHPYRVQGTEYALGAYFVASDVVLTWDPDGSGNVYVAYPHSEHYNTLADIKANYKKIGEIPVHATTANDYFEVGDIAVDIETGSWYASKESTSLSQGWCDRQYTVVNGNSTTLYEYLVAGVLRYGSSAGSGCVLGGGGVGYASWHFGGCD